MDGIRIPDPKNVFIKGFDTFTVTSYFSLLFIALENGLRTFYRPVCPLKDKPRTFFNVYDDILKELNLKRYFKLMQILRKIRNAVMHQNGIHVKMMKFSGMGKLSTLRMENL